MINPNGQDGLTAVQVADRLGVEVATVYAYASRGALTRRTGSDGRTSRYDPDEVELLAQRARPRSVRRGVGAVDVVIGTTVSEIGDGWIRYRGRDLTTLAGAVPFESVARLLWTGSLPEAIDETAVPARLRKHVVAAATRAAGALPDAAPVWARLAAGAAAVDTLLPDPDTDVEVVGLLLIDALVATLPLVDGATERAGLLAARLWPRVSPLAPTAPRLAALDTAMSLLAEHELATSTLAVRVATSTGASPSAAVLAGLGAVSGPLHGGAAIRVQERFLADPRPGEATAAGFGHSVHHHGDPRYPLLVAAASSIASPARRARIAADARSQVRAGAPPANVDAALGALGWVARMPLGATEAIFAVSRVAGWLAHAFEEADEAPLRYRGRTLYRGPR